MGKRGLIAKPRSPDRDDLRPLAGLVRSGLEFLDRLAGDGGAMTAMAMRAAIGKEERRRIVS